MTDAIAHRGPDGEGIDGFDNCLLGHRRLSIVDLATGDQPMYSPDGKKLIVFNGEIYGYKRIRSTFPDYPFRTTSDTEVILALYERHGSGLFERMPGMFAIALWDQDRQQLLCGRDRFGEKPFYYAFGTSGEFIFASEIKAILASGLITPEIDPESLTHYLQHLYVHPSRTIYKNIFTLPPAHFLVYAKGAVTISRYWNLPRTNPSISLDEAAENFSALFRQAIKDQLIADVPVGAFLSGGLDSSLVVAIAAEQQQRLKTISFGFGNEINELPYAGIVARKFNTDHIEIQQRLPDLGDLLLEMQRIYDEPFADSSNIPTYLISKAAAKELKVVLTGDGGDELLGGYAFWYRPLFDIENARSFGSIRKGLIASMARVTRRMGNGHFDFLLQQQHLLNGKRRSVKEIHEGQNIYFNPQQLQALGINAAAAATATGAAGGSGKPWSFSFGGDVSDAMKMDIEDYMPGDILVKTDRAAMANSLELRAPFLDRDLAEFCISLPYRLKLNSSEEKIIARHALGDRLPVEITRRKKQGFGAPVIHWLGSGSLQEMKSEYLLNHNRKIFNWIDPEGARKYTNQDSYQTWILLTLALWLENH